MTNFATLIAKQANSKIVLYRAVCGDGREFYAYIRCNEKQVRKMKADFLSKTACSDVVEYGEVIYTGLGNNPDEVGKEFLAEYIKKCAE